MKWSRKWRQIQTVKSKIIPQMKIFWYFDSEEIVVFIQLLVKDASKFAGLKIILRRPLYLIIAERDGWVLQYVYKIVQLNKIWQAFFYARFFICLKFFFFVCFFMLETMQSSPPS